MMHASIPFRNIAIEGPIGSGKTTLATRLAAHLQATLLLEKPEQNPFLNPFYQDTKHYALATQLSFLMQRIAQQEFLQNAYDASNTVISDYLFDKDSLFAELNLNTEEYALYQDIQRHCMSKPIHPDLVIYLQAPTDLLLKRIESRGLNHEKAITHDYLSRVADRYTRFFLDYKESPVLVINTEFINFEQPQVYQLLLEQLHSIKGGRAYWNAAEALV